MALVQPGPTVSSLFRSFPLVKLGTVSYAVYIIHQGTNYLFHYACVGAAPAINSWATGLVTLLSLSTALAVAALSWRLLEKPLLRRAHTQFRYIDATEAPPTRTSPRQNSGWGGAWRIFTAAEAWLSAHAGWLVGFIVLASLYLRLERAAGTYLNSDEAEIMLPPLQSGLANAYRAALIFPYGPFVNVLLHYMTFLGFSEVYFRLPSILAGALIPWVAYRWAADQFGKTAGLATAVILGFSPSLVNLSAQVRHYTIHMLFVVCSLYCLERAFRDHSPKWMRLFGMALLMALLTMYMSVWFTAAIGLYALVRIVRKELPRRLVMEWLAIQFAAVAVLAVAYATHLYQLRGSESELSARDGWLRSSYYHAGPQGPLAFVAANTDRLFGYTFANGAIGTWMIVLFVLGIALLLWRKGSARSWGAASLLLPLAATAAAALIGFYPYGGSRHDAFLSLFVAAAIAVTIAFVFRQKVTVLLAASVLLVPQWRAAEQHHILDELPEFAKIQQMNNALEYLRTRAPAPRVLVVDRIGASTVKYYLCHGKTSGYREMSHNLAAYRCAGYEILGMPVWGASARDFGAALLQARENSPELFPDPVWVFQVNPNAAAGPRFLTENDGSFGKLELHRIVAGAIAAPRRGQGNENLALGQDATQSSTYSATTIAARAVDGITDGDITNNSVTHTNLDANAWWQVDLGSSATVKSVVIANRTDCCGDRLGDYWVFISDQPFSAADTPANLQKRPGVWGSHQTTAPQTRATIAVPDVHGRYVRVQLSGTNYLSLAEVQVIGK